MGKKETNKETVVFKATLSERELIGLQNVDFTAEGYLTKRKGWKTFDGMIEVLEELNTRYRKLGYVGDFTIRLPLKRYRKTNKQI